MDLRLLNYFVVLCEELNYGRAAKRLFITQPTLSQQMKSLEENLNCQLITKEHHKLSLTAEGEVLKIQAYKLLRAANETKLLLAKTQVIEDQKITIYSSGCHFFTESLAEYAQDYPAVSVKIDECSSKNVVRNVMEERADFGLVYLPLISNTGDLAVEELFEDQFFITVNKDHPLGNYHRLSLKALESERLILVKPSLAVREMVGEVAVQKNLNLRPNYEFPNYVPCLDLVRQNVGVTILPLSFAKFHSLDKLQLIEIEERIPKATLAFLYRKEKVFAPHQLAFINQIKARFRLLNN